MRIFASVLTIAFGMWVSAGAFVAPGERSVATAVDRFLAGSAPSLTSYRATRQLHASTRGGKMQGMLRVRTQLDPQNGFRYEVLESTGSGLIQKRVLLAALEAERQMHANGTGPRGALTTDNYDFLEPAHADTALVRVDLKARRHDTLLLDGAMFLTPDGYDLVRVEGVLVKRPSFWTRKVNVVRRYGRISGVRVPLAMESTAQILIVGTSTFAMTYDYEMVNGATVGK